ncbi:AraC family transcriptional regulator [Leptospira sp. 201903070]|uniref:AraC family transcriptional regulator n=1 Tax=Leptospira ainlahdjerensis TaxID=2810033 RepID=A0ABS2UGH4_9LEPT|nr:AraC family transcriptional regulator [Leptospira ainlahdjerensis]
MKLLLLEFAKFVSILSIWIGSIQILRFRIQESIYTSLLYLCFGISQLYLILLVQGIFENGVGVFTAVHVPLLFFLGPLIYLYIQTVLDSPSPSRFSSKTFRNFIPGFIYLLILLAYHSGLFPKENFYGIVSLQNRGNFRIVLFLSNVSILIYILFSFLQILIRIKIRSLLEKRKIFALFILAFSLIAVILSLLSILEIYRTLQISSMIASFIVFIVHSTGQIYPELTEYLRSEAQNPQHRRTYLQGKDPNEIAKILDKIMEIDRIYRNENLRIADVAKVSGLSTHQLSEYLNNTLKTPFNRWINLFRIREAKQILLQDPKRTVLTIALEVGFNSLTTFHRVFLEEEKISPNQFRKSILKEKT